ncbi:hypothetical protein HY480_04645, partial [Candidatus Uhrbacteria bacterium]|nr:hypothetical protein [Candidatus Uhrbacteria bacterium]
ECDTCYRHGGRKTGWNGDMTWDAHSSNQEHVYHNGCNSPGTLTPARWSQITIGEPTAFEHSFTNYIKANPDSVLRRAGVAAQFTGALPAYPRVHDHYRAQRFLAVGVAIPEADALNARLSVVNAELGSPRQVNLTVIVTNVGDQMYLEALTEHWLGGKKNDLVVVIGAPEFPTIAWAGVMSWTRVEEVKLGIRDRIMGLGTFDGGKVLDIIASEVSDKFVRRPMADFEYLKATIEPPEWAQWTLFALGLLIAAVLQAYFWRNDPFETSARYGYRRW